jgi:hypothetical protein
VARRIGLFQRGFFEVGLIDPAGVDGFALHVTIVETATLNVGVRMGFILGPAA